MYAHVYSAMLLRYRLSEQHAPREISRIAIIYSVTPLTEGQPSARIALQESDAESKTQPSAHLVGVSHKRRAAVRFGALMMTSAIAAVPHAQGSPLTPFPKVVTVQGRRPV